MATIEEQIKVAEEKAEALKTKLKQLKAKQEQQAARELTKMLKGQRAEDTRRKILVGALILQQVEKGEVSREELMGLLDAYLARSDDRALFDLPPDGMRPASQSLAVAGAGVAVDLDAI